MDDSESFGGIVTVTIIYLVAAWWFVWWPFEPRWEGYFYPTSAFLVHGLDVKDARLIVGSYANEDLCYETLNEIADAGWYGDDDYILGCDKERAFEPF